jgi:hypothetical protein
MPMSDEQERKTILELFASPVDVPSAIVRKQDKKTELLVITVAPTHIGIGIK